ncbi:ribonuclease HIII [Chryseomicrobium palamuruense]|uniref:Ribonuclease HIII n=1 Tax=Chryseomicrobium palamuruense TaxID=682973 RepID=A0ABV8UZW0_9BACL
MSNMVIQPSNEQLDAIKKEYAHASVSKLAPGMIFAAVLPDVRVSMYKSGKVMFQGSGAVREAEKWEAARSSGTYETPTRSSLLPEGFAMKSVLGSDETGTGDFFGPITVAACYISRDQIALAQELGCKDSKQLNDTLIRKIAPDIKAAFPHSILVLPMDKYNKATDKKWSQGKIKALLHNQALKHVLRKMAPKKPEAILIDQFAEKGIYYRHIAEELEIIREDVYFATKAEGLHVSVAAASILARYAFLEEMDTLSESTGVMIPKGAGAKVDEVAARIIQKKGVDYLRTITKAHFANTQKAVKLAGVKK